VYYNQEGVKSVTSKHFVISIFSLVSCSFLLSQVALGFSAGELVLCTAATAASDSEWKLEAELKLFKDGSYMMFT
jgi:hypothetical protein